MRLSMLCTIASWLCTSAVYCISWLYLISNCSLQFANTCIHEKCTFISREMCYGCTVAFITITPVYFVINTNAFIVYYYTWCAAVYSVDLYVSCIAVNVVIACV